MASAHRTRGMWLAALLLIALMLGGVACSQETDSGADNGAVGALPPETPPDGTVSPSATVGLELVLDGFTAPLYVADAGDGSDRLFVVEKPGFVWIMQDGVRTEVFLDLSAQVSTVSEQGLLGIAFSPSFAEDGVFFASYTRADGASVLSRFLASGDVADRASEEVLLTVDQPHANHNGGMIEFGPDGYLYYGLGDGGGSGDPENNGQDPSTLLGTIMRLDVLSDGGATGDTPYAIPEDNPFVGKPDARPEVWAYGLRNPWRFSFDRETGDLWIGDVGQGAWEEIDFQPVDSAGGQNYGWNVYEGTHTYPPGAPEPGYPGGFTPPIYEYDRDAGKSVTGGYVYRGSAIPSLVGTYVYGDFVDGRIWGLARAADGTVDNRLLAQTHFQISSFGEDETGELYVVDFNGAIYRIVAE